ARDAQCYHDCCALSTLRVTDCTFPPHYRHFPPEIMQFVTRFRDRLQQDGSACKNPASTHGPGADAARCGGHACGTRSDTDGKRGRAALRAPPARVCSATREPGPAYAEFL